MIHIGVNLSDGDFAFALARGLSRNGGNIQVHLDNIGDCNLVLSDDERHKGKDNILYLSSESYICDSGNSVYKYADCRQINNKILERLKFKSDCNVGVSDGNGDYRACRGTGEPASKIIAFVGSSGGVGVTSAIMSISKILWKVFNKKVLYLNLQSKDTSGIYFGQISVKVRTQQLFYYLRNGIKIKQEEYIAPGIPNYIIRDEIDDFLYFADEDEIVKLIEAVNAENCYDYVFLDMGTELFTRNMKLTKLSDGVVEVKRSTGNFKTNILDSLADASPQVMRIENFSEGSSYDTDRIQAVLVDKEAFMFTEGIRGIKLDTSYGNDMWKFTHKFERLYG